MKKNNSNLADQKLDLGDLIRVLWREKILIVFVSSICGLLGYLIAFSNPTVFSKTQEIKVNFTITDNNKILINKYKVLISQNTYKHTNSFNITYQNYDLFFLNPYFFKFFLENNQKFVNFTGYLKSRDITVEQYFTKRKFDKFQTPLINENNYFLIFTKEFDENFFLDNYLEFINQKINLQIKNEFKTIIEQEIAYIEMVKESRANLNLNSNPIMFSKENIVFLINPEILLNNINNLRKIIIELEKDQFSSIIIKKKNEKQEPHNSKKILVNAGIIFGLGFSILIIFLKSVFKNKKF